MKIFKKRDKSSLRKKMIFYFLLIALANIFVAGEFVWEIKSESYRLQIVKTVNLIKEGKKPVKYIYNALDNLARKFVIMILILIVVSAVVLFLFVIQIASPIQYMINQARKMSEGDLSTRINIKTKDEVAILGKLINDLSINLQEVVAQLERLIYDLEEAVKLHQNNLKLFPNLKSYFDEEDEQFQQILKKFQILKDTYILFTIESIVKNVDMNTDDTEK